MLRNRSRREPSADSADDPAVSADELLDLLGDEYARKVLLAVVDQPRSGTEVASVTSVSKATAFRRLNRLEEAGLVETRAAINPENGHHHTEFRAAFDSLGVRLGPLDVTIERTA